MKLIRTIKKIQALSHSLSRRGKTIGFVPTMGALHEGHLSLVRASKRENDVTLVSIFVNPLQFGPAEDFKKYPRPLAKDLALLRKEKVDYVFNPSAEEMYPSFPLSSPNVSIRDLDSRHRHSGMTMPPITRILCGKFRPGHFQGVMTVVARLFEIIRPDRAYFGQKDYQQAKVIECLNRDLGFGINLRVLPTVREKDGLAMSSRNRYLKAGERRRARVLSETLFWIRQEIQGGNKALKALKVEGIRRLSQAVDRVQYLEVVDAETLGSVRKVTKKLAVLAACYLGKTRLIDNVIIRPARKRQ